MGLPAINLIFFLGTRLLPSLAGICKTTFPKFFISSLYCLPNIQNKISLGSDFIIALTPK